MFNKTTSYIFSRYGEIISDLTKKQSSKLSNTTFRIKDKSIDSFLIYNQDAYVKVSSGIVMLVVSVDEDGKEYEKFVIHRVIKIKAGVKFNFIAISSNARIELSCDSKTNMNR